MPHEIADSDAESDLNSPTRDPLFGASTVGPGNATASSQINFDEFLDPTQRLSFPSSGISSVERATGSTTRLLNEISDAHNALNCSTTKPSIHQSPDVSPVVHTKKRAQSALHDISTSAGFDDLVKSSRTKTTKTYGHRSKPADSESTNPFANQPEPFIMETATSVESAGQLSDPSAAYSTAHHIEINGSVDHNGGYSRPVNLLDQSAQSSLRNYSSSTASMGGYASINSNYRGSISVLDVNVNPFGSLSQVSLEEDPNSAEMEGGATFRCNDSTPQHHNTDGLPQNLQDAPQLIASTLLLEQHHHVDPTNLINNDRGPPEADMNSHRTDDPLSTELMPAPDTTLIADARSPAKKRGRKPKTPKAPAIAHDELEPDDLGLLDGEPFQRSRQGTVESISAASHASSTSKKRKRTKSRQVTKAGEQLVVPEEDSPVKHPSSDIQPSDEHILIGLPKEAYKPRPSRSRSKKIDEPDFQLSLKESSQTPIKDNGDDDANHLESTPVKKSTKKPGRKAKVRRAKTSALALSKRSEPMLSEGEDDVVWMDSKPAAVKLELPPDLKKPKQEEGHHVTAAEQKSLNITIEIPAAPGASPDQEIPSVAAPKKRGRKPKKVQLTQHEADSNQTSREHAISDLEPTRPPLSEKSNNIIPSAVGSNPSKAPTISPLSSPEQSPHTEPQPNESPTKPLSTPSKPTPPRGPTSHSPINSRDRTGKKTLYRIGLSRRQHIPSLLQRVQRDKAPPKIVVAKEKERKKKNAGDNGSDDDNPAGGANGEMRGADGLLIEWGD